MILRKVVPQIRIKKSKSGHAGQAYFRFENPEALLSDDFKDIQEMYLQDEEGKFSTREIHIAVTRKNGSYEAIEAI